MPTYMYECSSCKKQFSKLQKMSDEPIKVCPHCNCETLQRGVGGGLSLRFKGKGFYINDYAEKQSSSKAMPSKEKEPS